MFLLHGLQVVGAADGDVDFELQAQLLAERRAEVTIRPLQCQPSVSLLSTFELSYLEISGHKNHCFYLAIAAALQLPVSHVIALHRQALLDMSADEFEEMDVLTREEYLQNANVQEWKMAGQMEMFFMMRALGGRVALHLFSNVAQSAPDGTDAIVASLRDLQPMAEYQSLCGFGRPLDQADIHLCFHVCSYSGLRGIWNHFSVIELRPRSTGANAGPLRSYMTPAEYHAFREFISPWLVEVEAYRLTRGERNYVEEPANWPFCPGQTHDRSRARRPAPEWLQSMARTQAESGIPSWTRTIVAAQPAAAVCAADSRQLPSTVGAHPLGAAAPSAGVSRPATTAVARPRPAFGDSTPTVISSSSVTPSVPLSQAGSVHVPRPPMKPILRSGIPPTAASAASQVAARPAAVSSAAASVGGPVPKHNSPRQFTPDEVEMLITAMATGLTADGRKSNNNEVMMQLVAAFSARAPCTKDQIQAWLRRQHGEAKQSAANAAPAVGAARPSPISNVSDDVVMTESDAPLAAPPAPHVRAHRSRGRAGAAKDKFLHHFLTDAGRHYFIAPEKAYLTRLRDAGFNPADPAHAQLLKAVAAAFSRRYVCSEKSLKRWMARRPRDAQLAPVESVADVPPYVNQQLPRHRGLVASNRTGQRQGSSKSVDIPIEASVAHLWENSGLHLHRDVYDHLSTPKPDGVTVDEHARGLLQKVVVSLGQPVSDEIRSRDLATYNEYMDPRTPMLACASCGILQMHDMNVRLEVDPHSAALSGWSEHAHETPGLHPITPVRVNECLHGTSIQLTQEQVKSYLTLPPNLRPAFCVTGVQDHPIIFAQRQERDQQHLARLISEVRTASNRHVHGASESNAAVGVNASDEPSPVEELALLRASMASSDYGYSYYHLDDQLTHTLADGSVIVRLCVTCHSKLEIKGGAGVPLYSIAAGCDYGRPHMIGLHPLSVIEQTLLAAHRVFGQIVKLVAPFGMGPAVRQSAFTGHTIVFPHDGPSRLITHFPDVTDIHQSISVMFVGTRDQWSNTRANPTVMSKFRGIFEVRPAVLLQWLRALRSVGHPLYQNIDICDKDDPAWAEATLIGEQCLNQAHVTDDQVTARLERQSVADVAGVRQLQPEDIVADESTPPEVHDGTFFERSGIGSVMLAALTHPIELEAAAVNRGRFVTASTNVQVLRAIASATGVRPPDGVDGRVPGDTIRRDGPVRFSMSADPVNEFSENDVLLIGAFPHLFFLGRKPPTKSSLSGVYRQRLLRFHDQRFSTNHSLLFLLFNQLQRHTALRKIAAKVKSTPEAIQSFYDATEVPGFDQSLKNAFAHPESRDTEKLLRRFLPIIQTSGQPVPFSAAQRQQTLPRLIAYTHMFGLPSFFLTITPSDLDQPLTIRIAVPSTNPASDRTQRLLDFPMPALAERGRILAENPVAAAEIYQRIMEAVLKCFLGFLPTKRAAHAGGVRLQPLLPLAQRPQTIFGNVTAYLFVPRVARSRHAALARAHLE